MSMKINVSESQMDETTFKQAVDTFLDCAPEGGWNDYWAMQQDWAMFTDGLVRDGTVTDRQAGNWGNPCTPETFDSWQKRNGLTRRPRAWDESKECVSERAIPGGRAFLQKMSNAGLQDVLDKMSSKGITFELTNTDGPIYSPGYARWNGNEDKRFVGNLYQCKRSRKSGVWEGPIFLGWDKKLDIPYVYAGGSKYEGMFGSRNPFEEFMHDLDTNLAESRKKSDELDLDNKYRHIDEFENLLGMEISDAREEMGHWWRLANQDVRDSRRVYKFERSGLGVVTLTADKKNNIVKVEGRLLRVPFEFFKDGKVESKKSEGNASDYVGKYYVDIEDEDEGTLYSSDMEFVSARKASLWAFDELKKSKDDADVFQASVYQLFVNDDGDLDHELIEVIHKSDLDESKKSEATKFGAGMATRKDFSKTKNLGEIFDVLDEHLKSLKAASEDMSKSKEDLEASIKKLQEFEGYTDFLKQQSVKGIKKALTLKNSPEVQAASEIEKNLKDALSVIMSDYKNVTDVTQLMVVIDSKYATRGSQILTTLEGQVSRAIDVDMKTIKDSIESGDISEDDVMKLVTMTSVSKGMKNKDTATKVKPVLERMNAMLESASKVEEAIIDPQQFKELRDLVEQIVNEASTPKETIKTTITALDKETISTVPEAKDGGLLGKLKEFVKDIKDKIAGLWDSFTSLFFSIEDDALEASDVFDEVEAKLGEEGISIDAGKKATETLSKQFEVLTKSVLTCCDNLVKDAALAGEFDDEVIYAEEAVKNAVESFQNLGEACKSLKDSLSCHKNEDNMNVIGILADAITQIVADEEGVIEDEETADAEDDSNSVIDDVERRYSAPGGEQEEPEMGNEEPELGGEEEPEEF